MLGKRKLVTEGDEMEDNLEEMDMEIVREGMKLVPIPEVIFQGIPQDTLHTLDDQVVLKYDERVKGTKLLNQKNAGAPIDAKNCINVNSGTMVSQYFAVGKCNGNEAVLANAHNESIELVPKHNTMSDICPPDFSMWTVEDDLLLKNAVEAGAALEALAQGAVRFSRRFTVRELRERWHALLYNPEISAKAAAGMVEIELSQMGISKATRSSKLKGKDESVQKQKLVNVRNHYYRMRKRIDAERLVPVENNATIPNDTVVTCTGRANGVVQEEAATMHKVLPVTVGIEDQAIAPPFGLSEACLEIEDKTFSQMVSFIAGGGLEGVESAFPTTNVDSLEVNSAPISLMENGCYDFSRHDPSVMPSVTTVGSADEYISTEMEDMSQAVVHNAVTFHDRLYVVESSLPLDTMTVLTINNEPSVNPVPVVNHNPGVLKSIDTRYVRAEGFGQEGSEGNISALGMLSQTNTRNWEGNDVFLMPPMTADLKENVDEPMLSTEDKEDASGPKEPVRDGISMLSSFTTKEEIHISSEGLIQSLGTNVLHKSLQQSASVFLPDSSGRANVYRSGDGQDVLCNSGYTISGSLKDESQARPLQCVDRMTLSCSKNSAVERTVCVESNGLEMTSIPAYTASVPGQATQEWSHNMVKLEVNSSTFSTNFHPLLFVHEPMDCALNTEDTDVPCNDEFNPLAYQEPSAISAVVQSSYGEQITAWGCLSTEVNLGNLMPLCSGLSVVKEEPETLEPFVEAANELQSLAFKHEESNKSCTDYHRVKMEVLEYAVPSVVCQEVAACKDDCHPGVSSIGSTSVLPIALQEVIPAIPLVLENCPNKKSEPSSSHKSIQGHLHGNDSHVDFTKPLQFDVALTTVVQDNLIQASPAMFVNPIEAGLNDFQVISGEEAAVDQFPGNQEDQFSDNDEELPHFSDVEAMILDMDLDPVDDGTFSARAESKRLYKQHGKVIVRLEQTANAAMQRSLASKEAYAILYGRRLQYFIKKKKVTIGRVTQDNIVDIDLGKEGPPNRVSRQQATLKLKEDGLFYLVNHGVRISVNSHDITKGKCIRLPSNCLIEVGGMRFIFEINRRLVKEQIE